MATTKEKLKKFGIEGEAGQSGVIHTLETEYKQEEKRVVRSEERTVSATPERLFYTLQLVHPLAFPCIFGFEAWCWERKYADPSIYFEIKGVKADDIDIYVLSGKIEGKIITKFTNWSEEGETWEENKKTGETRNRHKVDGSADLSGNFDEIINLRDIDEKLAKIKDRTIKKTEPDLSINIKSDFKKSGYFDLLKSIFDLLVVGKIYIDDSITVTVRYKWRGETKEVSKDIDIRAWLPVGDVNWHAW